MSSPLFILVAVLMVATVGVMLMGIVNLAKGGAKSDARSGRLMVWRVGLQAATLAMLGLLFLIGKTGTH